LYYFADMIRFAPRTIRPLIAHTDSVWTLAGDAATVAVTVKRAGFFSTSKHRQLYLLPRL
jgi:hypothetical protein